MVPLICNVDNISRREMAREEKLVLTAANRLFADFSGHDGARLPEVIT